jgi:hypothetical protein
LKKCDKKYCGSDDNNAPIFVYGEKNTPIPFIPKLYYWADLPEMLAILPTIWD